METPLSQFQRRQLEVIARVTPHSMAGHILNTTVLAVAVAGSIPARQLIIWCIYSYAIALVVLYRHMRSRGRVPRNFQRATRRATIYAFLLALPWSIMAVLHWGELAHDQEVILLALAVGMAASGTILLSAMPIAALSYMSAILIPSAVKSLLFINQKGYLLLGVLALSYWWLLAALIAKVSREISDRKRIDVALKESEIRLQQTLTAGQIVAFSWNPETGMSQRSENASTKPRPRAAGGRTWAGQGLPRTSASGGPQMLRCPNQGAVPRKTIVFGFLSLHPPGWAGGVVRRDRQCGVRCDRPPFAPQRVDLRHHRAQARRRTTALAGP